MEEAAAKLEKVDEEPQEDSTLEEGQNGQNWTSEVGQKVEGQAQTLEVGQKGQHRTAEKGQLGQNRTVEKGQKIERKKDIQMREAGSSG